MIEINEFKDAFNKSVKDYNVLLNNAINAATDRWGLLQKILEGINKIASISDSTMDYIEKAKLYKALKEIAEASRLE